MGRFQQSMDAEKIDYTVLEKPLPPLQQQLNMAIDSLATCSLGAHFLAVLFGQCWRHTCCSDSKNWSPMRAITKAQISRERAWASSDWHRETEEHWTPRRPCTTRD